MVNDGPTEGTVIEAQTEMLFGQTSVAGLFLRDYDALYLVPCEEGQECGSYHAYITGCR